MAPETTAIAPWSALVRRWRSLGVALMASALALPPQAPAPAADLDPDDSYRLVRRMMSADRKQRREAARELEEAGDRSLVPALVDSLFFTSANHRAETLEVLATLTGERHREYYDWVEYVGGSGLEARPGYLEFKLLLLSKIDPSYRKVLYPGAPSRIRLEEVVWGGVPLAGIPALDDPPVVRGSEAAYLKDDEKIFGLSLGGESRAYPLRILSWHEMLNDVVGGRPVTLSFCTLCGSGILYDASTPAGGRHRFGTSGLLYRSNKLMFDHRTFTLWSNLTGEPVIGRLARSPIGLEALPMTVTSWGAWLASHPQTTVLDLEAIAERGSGRYRFDYRPGAADRARAGVAFPVWLTSDRLERQREVFAMRQAGSAKVYPVDRVLKEVVINDELGGRALVLVADPGSGAIRAYARAEHRFRPAGEPGALLDEEGRLWSVAEHELTPPEAVEALVSLPRLPGHLAFWFGWYAFYPDTEVYGGS